jgi:hypothetical protein
MVPTQPLHISTTPPCSVGTDGHSEDVRRGRQYSIRLFTYPTFNLFLHPEAPTIDGNDAILSGVRVRIDVEPRSSVARQQAA